MAPNHLRGVAITGRMPHEYDSMLTPEAISFVAHLARMYTPRVTELLNRYTRPSNRDIAPYLLSSRRLQPCCLRFKKYADAQDDAFDVRLAHLRVFAAPQQV